MSSFARNNYSQFGEDGIIEKIFEIIGTSNKICIEFGAWDGFYLSNTAHLWSNDLEWKAILIESDSEKCIQLTNNLKKYNCLAINRWVGKDSANCLESILKDYNIDLSIPVDILSIDIDGNDYYVIDSLKDLKPRVIVCEYNPTIPFWHDIYAEYSSDNYFGASLSSIVRVAESKGYSLIATTEVNAFFVRQELFEKFNLFETDIRFLANTSCYSSLITSYGGEYLIVNDRFQHPYGVNKKYTKPLFGNFKISRKSIV